MYLQSGLEVYDVNNLFCQKHRSNLCLHTSSVADWGNC